MSQSRTVIIGGGVIGLSCAYALRNAGYDVVIIDRDFEGDKTSFGNAGALAVTDCMPVSHPGVLKKVPKWLFDPLGPLSISPGHAHRLIPWLWHFYRAGRASESCRYADALSALNNRTYDDLRPLLGDIGMTSELEETGALVLYKNRRAFEQDKLEWVIKKDRGVHFELLTREDIVELEPSVGSTKTFGVFQPDWSLLKDPKKLMGRLGDWLSEHGAHLVTDDVAEILTSGAHVTGVKLASSKTIPGENVIVAGGAWSGAFAEQMGDKVLLESERGYNTTVANPGITVGRMLIFAEEKFVVSPLAIGLRIGGAAEFAGLSRLPNFERAKALVRLAQRHLPDLKVGADVEWMGHRSSTPDSVPIIGPSPNVSGLYYAFGHGHLGLTHAATTGQLIADLIVRNPATLDLSPYSIDRFSA